ncbi:MAG TPA: aromatic-ring-hydroxylating dioxygenase subunit beta [Acidimicrobiales bacterium]|nr:aromatic-ring-hydroxylating dioxygenase subunit beta [Acidimicrobiales bacterium]
MGPTTAAPGRARDRDLRHEAEDFLYDEAALLDAWRLEEWLELFLPECRYVIPATDLPDGDTSRDLALVSDDRFLLGERVRSLLKRSAHAEFPHSRTRRLIANVRAVDHGAEGIVVTANFAVYRVRREVVDCYVGEYRHQLERGTDGELRFRERKAVLDLDALRPHGKVSIIL